MFRVGRGKNACTVSKRGAILRRNRRQREGKAPGSGTPKYPEARADANEDRYTITGDRGLPARRMRSGQTIQEAVRSPSTAKTQTPGKLIHVDLCGPMQNPLIAGTKYFLLFIKTIFIIIAQLIS